ncbi:MAG: right-handed parallel beta-helix repeat-containing protein, partial [Elusimicrobia bacterium]|nr:right-handed parallel beta-helix repeat-containing protein [Elusimicrobiota bacterium]
SSNTIAGSLSSSVDSYGLYLNGLKSGATLQNNAIVFRTAGGTAGRSYYGLYGQSVRSLKFDHNRVSNPGMVGDGSFIGAYFTDTQATEFKFNDVNSTASATLQEHYLLRLQGSTVTVKNNIFFSSAAVSVSSASLLADVTSGLDSDYNDWFSSNTYNTIQWGNQTAQFSSGWLGKDGNSISANPFWANPSAGIEDFHPLSMRGRYNPDSGVFTSDSQHSPTIDAADTAETTGDEPSPNGSRANLGSYGRTAEASQSTPSDCLTYQTVRQSGPATCSSIVQCINNIPNTALSGSWCIDVLDGATYSQQLTIQNKNPNNHQIRIGSLSGAAAPIINPQAGAIAGFRVLNSSVSIENVAIITTNTVNYGIQVSSSYVSISSASIDSNARINTAGILISSYGIINHSSVTVQSALGIMIVGSGASISYSSAAANSGSFRAIFLSGANSAILTNIYANNPGGRGLEFSAASASLVSSGTIRSSSAGSPALFVGNNSNSNIVQLSTLVGVAYGVNIDVASGTVLDQVYINANDANASGIIFTGFGSQFNQIIRSTVEVTSTWQGALNFNSAGSFTTVRDSVLKGSSGYVVYLSYPQNVTFLRTRMISSSPDGVLIGTGEHRFEDCVISNSIGPAIKLQAGATILRSTITSSGTNQAAIQISGGIFNKSISGSWIEASTGVYVGIATSTLITSNFIRTTQSSGYAVRTAAGVSGLTLSSNTLVGGDSGYGIYVGSSAVGSIIISTNNISAAQYGIFIGSQTGITRIWIGSNTISSPLGSSRNSYGLFLNGLNSGATVHNNAIVYRSPGGSSGRSYYGIYAQAAHGLHFTHNRINQPGMAEGGSFAAAYLSDTSSANLRFNDFNSTATASLQNAYLLQLINSTAVIKNNVFFSSMNATLSSATIYADQASGFTSNYNDFFSSHPANTLMWGPFSFQFPWNPAIGQDANSISAFPHWFNASAGVEDFHPLSEAGRYVPATGSFALSDAAHASTIDSADPDEDYSQEQAFNGSRANMGSYGNTLQASLSPNGPPDSAVLTVWMSSISVSYAANGAQAYVIETSTAANFTGQVYSSATSAYFSPLNPQDLLPHTTYFLRAGALWGAVTYYADSIPASTSTLARPVAGAQIFQVNASSVAVNWLPHPAVPPEVSSNSASGYLLQASTAADFTGLLFSSQSLGVSQSTLTLTLSYDTTYYFRVASLNWNLAPHFSHVGSTLTLPGQLPGCAVTLNVRQDDTEDFGSIQEAVSSLTTLTGNTCIVIRDGLTYGEEVAIRNIDTAGHRLKVMGDPYMPVPTITPPAGSTAAFQIANSSVDLLGLAVTLDAVFNYAIVSSSENIGIASVTVTAIELNATGNSAAVLISSRSIVTGLAADSLNRPALRLEGEFSRIESSTLTMSGIGNGAIYAVSVTSSTFYRVTARATGGSGAGFTATGSGHNNLVSSTFTNLSAVIPALGLFGSSNTVSGSWIHSNNTSGFAMDIGSYNRVYQSTISGLVRLTGSSGNELSELFISKQNGSALGFQSSAVGNAIRRSTITSINDTFGVIQVSGSTNNLISECYIQGAIPVYNLQSSGTVISGSILISTASAGNAIQVLGGGMSLAVSSSTLRAGPSGSAIHFSAPWGPGAVNISSNTLIGGRYGVFISTQGIGTRIWVGSNTIVSSLSPSIDTYGIYLNGLRSGATIQNNSIVFRSAGGATERNYYGLYGQSVRSLKFDHNRVSNPGMVAAGSFTAVHFHDTQATEFKFNDVNSTASAILQEHYLLRLQESTVTVKNNIFFSSAAVSVSSASLLADVASGLDSDYNDWFSSNSANTIQWGNQTAQFSSGWLGKDGNSISANPFWANPSAGIEDFHPMSTASNGRYNMATATFDLSDGLQSQTIDAGDPAEDVAIDSGLGLEPED